MCPVADLQFVRLCQMVFHGDFHGTGIAFLTIRADQCEPQYAGIRLLGGFGFPNPFVESSEERGNVLWLRGKGAERK